MCSDHVHITKQNLPPNPHQQAVKLNATLLPFLFLPGSLNLYQMLKHIVYYLQRDLDTIYDQVLRISSMIVFDINNKNHSQWAKITFKKSRM